MYLASSDGILPGLSTLLEGRDELRQANFKRGFSSLRPFDIPVCPTCPILHIIPWSPKMHDLRRKSTSKTISEYDTNDDRRSGVRLGIMSRHACLHKFDAREPVALTLL